MVFTDRVLVIDPVTDATETAAEAKVAFPVESAHDGTWAWGHPKTVIGPLVRRLYDSKSAESYGEGSYTITRTDYETASRRPQ